MRYFSGIAGGSFRGKDRCSSDHPVKMLERPNSIKTRVPPQRIRELLPKGSPTTRNQGSAALDCWGASKVFQKRIVNCILANVILAQGCQAIYKSVHSERAVCEQSNAAGALLSSWPLSVNSVCQRNRGLSSSNPTGSHFLVLTAKLIETCPHLSCIFTCSAVLRCI